MRITHRRKSQLCGALLLAAVVIPPVPAAAQTASAAPNPPIKIGPVEVWPTLVFRNIGIDPNVFNEPENPRRDFTATMVPTLEFVIRPPRMRLSQTTVGDFVYFRKNKQERSIHRAFSARAEADLTHIHPFATFGSTRSRQRNTEIDLRAGKLSRAYGAGVRAALGKLTSVTVSARQGTNRYDAGQVFRGVDLATELNHVTNALDASFNREVTPLTSVGLVVAKEELRYDHSPLRNSDSLRIAPTISFQPLARFSGSASVGWLRFDAVDPNVEDYSGLGATGTIGFTIVDRFHIETTFGREVRSSYESNTPTYVWTAGRSTVRTVLFRGLDVRVTAGRDVMAYRALADVPDAVPRRDLVNLYSVGLGFSPSKRLRIGVDAEFNQRRSGDASRGYTSNRIYGSVAYGVSAQ